MKCSLLGAECAYRIPSSPNTLAILSLLPQPEDPSGAFFGHYTISILEATATAVPTPSARCLFGTDLLGLVGMASRKARLISSWHTNLCDQ
jgi:hypothetical protein